MIIFAMGIPESGTDWCAQVFEKIADREQFPLRTVSPAGASEVDSCLQSLDANENVLVQFHNVTPAACELAKQGYVRPFFHYRDPRDVVVRLMRNRNLTFQQAQQTAISAYQFLPHVVQMPGIMLIPHAHLEQHAEAIVFQMASRLGRLLNLERAEEIAQAVANDDSLDVQSTSCSPDGFGAAVTDGAQGRIDGGHLADGELLRPTVGSWSEELSISQQIGLSERFEPVISLLGFGF